MSSVPATYFDVATVDGITVVHFTGPKLVLEAGEHLYSLVNTTQPGKLLLDFSRVHFLSSAGLSVLVNLKKMQLANGARLVLCAIEPDLLDLLRITRLKDLFEIHATKEEAAAALNG